MPSCEWLQHDQRNNRRSIADAIDVLPSDGAWTGEIRVGGLRLPSQEVVGQVAVLAENAAAGLTSIVSLPACKKFRARRHGSQESEKFDIFRLDGAAVDDSGHVELVDGTRLRAVEVIPAPLPDNVTDLDWLIVHHTIDLIQAQQECYRSLIPELPPVLDCSKLPALSGKIRIPELKVIQGHIADREPALANLSEQQIANTLRKFGIRIPRTRPRRAGATPTP
ncbi:hypothetical protein JQ596_11425 [Bradyrhizobium manausense]|uniref:hypothetical protein n=1 Tax=Bradyrhizobium manausense TaxID=989370 RepID=UPI001BABA5BA|nr:hypothetical protein [Bradyrhizobium manausense]MBR0826151.1 hypothetical protein [Bradyrhizobium manausense]